MSATKRTIANTLILGALVTGGSALLTTSPATAASLSSQGSPVHTANIAPSGRAFSVAPAGRAFIVLPEGRAFAVSPDGGHDPYSAAADSFSGSGRAFSVSPNGTRIYF
jgi:hypothetical protein